MSRSNRLSRPIQVFRAFDSFWDFCLGSSGLTAGYDNIVLGMDISAPENCQTCFRRKAEDGAQLPIQWISVCRCDRLFNPNAQFSIDVCGNCKRRIPVYAKDTVTRLDLCSCSQPNPQKIATHIKQNETDPVVLDLASMRIAPERFPSERYAPIALLGDSPRATVLLCRDRQRGTKVAVKCFKMIPPSLYQMFDSEVRKNKQLTHTNIAKIVDSGVHNNNAPYVVSEYKDGFNLEQCVSLYGFPSHDVAIKILIDACETLGYAQKQGVMHRDLRPGNIIFVDDLNSQPSIALTDFALPKVKAAEQLTDRWLVLYISGDEARNLEFSEKSEVYCMGSIGYSMLAGRPPFQNAPALEIKNMHALQLPPRTSVVNFDKTRPSDLDEVIEKCLEKDPRDRFESIAKLQERLEVFPRRVQMQIASILSARKRAKIMRFAAIGAAIAALCAAGFFAVHH